MKRRKGDWSETYTGKKFWTLDPKPEDICIEDIAHALSQICRYGGHCKHFYSVAQHSIIVAEELKRTGANNKVQMHGLLHDAAEAYICDIPRPFKACIEEYEGYEMSIQGVIYTAFGLELPSVQEFYVVNYIDNEVLYNEALQLTNNIDNWAIPIQDMDIDVSSKDMCQIETEFLNEFNQLFQDIKG